MLQACATRAFRTSSSSSSHSMGRCRKAMSCFTRLSKRKVSLTQAGLAPRRSGAASAAKTKYRRAGVKTQEFLSQWRSDMAAPAKNTVCLWYNGGAEEAARFYADTFPDSFVGAVYRAPGDFPSGKTGDVLTVEFTVMGIPCLGLNGGPAFTQSEAFSFQVATADQAETDRYWNAIVGQWWPGKRLRLVQRQVGVVVANNTGGPDESHCRPRPSCRQARIRRDDENDKNRRQCN